MKTGPWHMRQARFEEEFLDGGLATRAVVTVDLVLKIPHGETLVQTMRRVKQLLRQQHLGDRPLDLWVSDE